MESAKTTIVTLEVDKQLLDCYIFYTAVLILKTALMTALVGLSRIKYNALCNPEEAAAIGAKVNREHQVVERNRRAHLNDLENVPFFIIACFLYITVTNPAVEDTKMLIKTYVWTRVAFSLAYVYFQSVVRVALFQVNFFINLYMIVSVILHYL